MITTAAWVPRGFAAPFPQKYDFDEDEFERIASLAKLQLDDANEDLEEAQNKDGEDDDDEDVDSDGGADVAKTGSASEEDSTAKDDEMDEE